MKKVLLTLKKWATTNVGYKIIAIIFAFIVWLVVVNIQNPSSTRTFTNIPVTVVNEEKVLDGNHVYTIVSGKTASITVAGTRTVLAGLNSSDFVAEADFSLLSMTNAAPITVYLSTEKARYSNQIDITVNTQSMKIDVENIITKEVPVAVQYLGIKPSTLTIDEVTINPETVKVSVPESKSNQVSKVVAMVNYDEIVTGEVMSFDPVIVDVDGKEVEQENGISVDVETINIQFDTYAEKDVAVKAEYFGTPATGYEVKNIKYSTDEIAVRGPADVLDTLTEINIPETEISVSNKVSNVTETVDISEYLPEKVTPVNESDAYVTVTVVIGAKEETTASYGLSGF